MNTTVLKRLGKNIKKYRLLVGLTQEQLAEKINVHQTYIGKIEIGICSPSVKLLYSISRKLKVKLSNIFDFD